jgi:hypothetical protein
MSLLSNPSFTNIIFTANGSNGVHILEGTLSSNATLASRSIAGIANVAYIIDNLTIGPSAILTIKPGVVIKFANSWCNCSGIDVQGALVADGTAVQPIVFTSFQDDSNGGDTNNDGNTSVPARGNWNAVDFHASSLDTLNSLTYCNFRYGGSNWWAGYYYGEVRIYDAGVKINHCTFEQSNSTGMGIFGSAHPEILNSNIYNVSNAPIAMSMFSNPTFTTDSILNAVYMAIGIVPETYSVSSTVPIRSIGGFSNITYYMYSTCTVNTGTEITIPAGIVFKGGNWQVNGALSMLGTASQPVVFTDPADDTYGNPRDTQEDGTATQPSIQGGSWITYNDVSTDSLSTVRHAIFRYRDAAIYLQQAAPKFSHNTFDHDNYGLVLNGVSTPVVDSCLFKDLTYSPLRISLVSYPRSTLANLISGSTYRAISVTDETLVQDVTLAKRNFAGINNIPYLFDTYTVASNAVLTIEPGVVLKFWPGSGNGIHVNKGLMAIGGSAADSNIVFTEIRDDFYGGDTNADSTKSSPWDWYPGWNGITFSGESLDPLCQLSHCIIRYAGNGPWGNQAGITTNNASPTITYCRIIDNYFGIVANGSANPIVNYCDIYNDSHLGIYNVNGSFNIDARWNWWGSNTGPTHSGNPGGTGQAVSDDVDYSNYLGTGSANPVMGDVSLNGSVQAFDASLVLKYVVNPTGDTLNAIQQQVADVSGTTGITAYDASLILQYVVNLISGFPAEINTSVKQFPSDTKGIFALQKVSNVQLSIGATTVNRGQSFTIPITLRNFSGVASVYLSLKYDPELISFDVVKATDLSANMQVTFFNDKEKGLLRVAMAGSEMLQSDGDIANLTFSVANDVRGKVSTQIGIDRFLANESDLTQLTSPAEIQVVGKPISYQLDQNYPNPFNPSTTIGYQLPEDNTYVHLVIYSITGQVLKTLVNESQNAGEYKVVWNGTSDAGLQVSSGVYFCRITADKFVQMKKLLLLK